MSALIQHPDIYAEHVFHAQAYLGEGAIWQPNIQKLYWVDIEGKLLHIYDPVADKDIQLPAAERIGTVVPVSDTEVLVALQTGIHQMNTASGNLKLLVNPVEDPGTRFNDGKCDPAGRFWVGTIAPDPKQATAELFCLDRDKKIRVVLKNITNSNGIAWSADKSTMYYIDTPTRFVQAFSYDDVKGTITDPRIAVNIPEGLGYPDGMTIDREDKLWIALWGAGAVGRFDPLTGELLQIIRVPAPNVSSCAFGDKDLGTLYITTARQDLSEQELELHPLSGDLFRARPGVYGVNTNFYKGNAA